MSRGRHGDLAPVRGVGAEEWAMGEREPVRVPQRYALFDTAIGTLGIAWSAVGLTALQLPEADRAATERRLSRAAAIATDPPAAIRDAIGEITAYCRGSPVAFASVDLDLARVPGFAHGVYAAARAIPWGRTATYGELARRIGQPLAARAVGQALGQNPLPIIIPCHRILASGGKLGGFSAYRGARTKRQLLALEGVQLGGHGMPMLPGLLPAEG
jgi:methylated-DNA-[protein]-cysteine S-methyltransferase